jgi:hypothetical protein
MARLEAELIDSLSSQPVVGDTAVAVIERAFATLGDAGHARMLAWRALQAADPNRDAQQKLLRALSDAVHVRRVAFAKSEGQAPPSAQDTEFVVRLAAAAMLGDGIFAPFLDASFGRAVDAARQRRFREWFARLLAAHTGVTS